MVEDIDENDPRIAKLKKLFYDDNYLEDQLKYGGMLMMLIEYLRDWMAGRLRGFFGEFDGFNKSGDLKFRVPEKYKYLFLKDKNGHPFEKQLKWFVDLRAIEKEEADLLVEMLKRRNDIGHDLVRIIVSEQKAELYWIECKAIVNLIFKLDKWWFREIEVATGALDDIPNTEEVDLKQSASVMATMLLQFVEKIGPADENIK